MLYCPQCRVTITGDHSGCPLCHGPLEGEPEYEEPCCPCLDPEQSHSRFYLNLLNSFAILAAIAAVAINIVTPAPAWWSAFLVAGIGCGWLAVVTGVRQRANLMKNIVWQLVILSLLAFCWDIGTGWHGWSLTYVLPGCCIAAMVLKAILAAILRLPPQDYITYLAIDILWSLIPAALLFTSLLTSRLPSLICVAYTIIFVISLLSLEGRAIYKELSKKLHL